MPMLKTKRTAVHTGDCREVLQRLADGCAHLVLTDPPYFLDGLDNNWSKGNQGRGDSTKNGAIGGLPVGMKFDPGQSRAFQKFLDPIAEQLLRVLKPGGFALMFSAPRLAHRAAVALEDAGFEIRDHYAWRYTKRAQFKAFTLSHFVERRALPERERRRIIESLGGRRTPQLRPQFESIVVAQKPRAGTFVDNWLKHETGLVDASQSLDGNVPSTVMTVEKDDKDVENTHLTPKPVALIEHLIRLFTMPGHVVVDPFLGSGTTCVAAQRTDRIGIGIEISPAYAKIARQRVKEVSK